MTTSMNIINLIIIKEISDKSYINGSAIYHSNKKNYNHFDFKLFNNLNNKDIHSFEGDIVVLTGKFCFHDDYDGDNPLFVYIKFLFFSFYTKYIY